MPSSVTTRPPSSDLMDAEHTHNEGTTLMTPWVDRVKFPSISLEYIGNIILNLLIVVSGIMLFMIASFLFAS